MRLEFGPDDESAYQRAAEKLCDRFDAWAGAQGHDDDRFVAEQLLHFKWGYLDGHLGRWRAADLGEIFLELFPRKVVMAAAEVPELVPAAGRFLAFLDDAGLLDPASDDRRRLADALDLIAAELPNRMADPANFGLAKSLFSGAEPPALSPVPFPRRVRLAGHDELTAAAADVPLLARLATFVAWLGDGRKLTAKGNLALADGKELIGVLDTADRFDRDIGGRVFKTKSTVELGEVDFAFRLAGAAGFVKVRKGRLTATKRGAALGTDPLADWHAAFDGLLDLGVLKHRYAHAYWLDPYWKELIDEEVARLFVGLLADGAPAPIEELQEQLWDLVQGAFVLDDLNEEQLARHRDYLDHDVRRIVDAFARLGALTVDGVEVETTTWGTELQRGGEVALSALGVAAAHRLALAAGFDVPTVGALRDAAASRLLTAIAGLDDVDADEEIAAWLGARSPEAAAGDVVDALVDAQDDLGAVSAAFRILNALPTRVAATALRTCADDERLGPFVAAWTERHGPGAEVRLDAPSSAHLRAVATLDGPAGLLEALAAVGDAEAQARFLDGLRGDGAQAAPVLAQVAAHHPDKPVAKAARKALFKLRSSGVL